MPDDLYATDALSWSMQQADLLRRLAAGERVNDVDWPHVIEEIESVGISEMRAVRSGLLQAMIHLLKLAGWPGCTAADHWRTEIATFLGEAATDYRPSMRQLLDLPDIYRRALKSVRFARIDGAAPGALAASCPIPLEELLGGSLAVDAWAARLAAPQGTDHAE